MFHKNDCDGFHTLVKRQPLVQNHLYGLVISYFNRHWPHLHRPRRYRLRSAAENDLLSARPLPCEDGSVGWHAPAKDGQPTVMVFHGNASSIDSNMHIFQDLHAAGYGVWSVGYPGYPGSAGDPSQDSLTSAALAQYDTLNSYDVETIIFYGTSLGSAVVAQLAEQKTPDLIILDAPFNSMSDMAHRQMPVLPTQFLLKDKWASDQALAGSNVPLLWIHGTADQIVPLTQGQTLFENYKGPKDAHVISGAHHTNTWLLGGRERVLARLKKL